MIILAGTIRVAAGKQNEATKVLARLIEATRAEAGCLAYSFAFDLLDDRTLRIFEVFRDEAALAAHRASAHMTAWRAEMPSLGISDRDLSQYEATSMKRI
jgi:quinol monooxygenase YgiN